MCGFTSKTIKQPDGTYKVYTAPSKSAYSKFLKNLMQCQDELDTMFGELVKFMYANLEHFGEILMADGKAIQSYAARQSKNKKAGERGNSIKGVPSYPLSARK